MELPSPDEIFPIRTPEDFAQLESRIFAAQTATEGVFAQFTRFLGRPRNIPVFLPVDFFKSASVRNFKGNPEIVFTSSTTTGSIPSRHEVFSKTVYLTAARESFRHFYGDPAGYCHFALLPSYLERSGSSLVMMVDDFIHQSRYPESGFFLDAGDQLKKRLAFHQQHKIPTILWGVTFALMDFAEATPMDLSHIIIMETGGMKGRRKEITRDELHAFLGQQFQSPVIHSEYGMTELLSQAYSTGNGRFHCPPWMKVVVMEITDPLREAAFGKTGRICLIDLANLYSCSFIATEDAGIAYADGSFEIKGRLDHSDIRGCNLMIS